VQTVFMSPKFARVSASILLSWGFCKVFHHWQDRPIGVLPRLTRLSHGGTEGKYRILKKILEGVVTV